MTDSNSRVQVIRVGEEPVAYVVPADLWPRVQGLVEDAEDAQAYKQAVAADDGERTPAEVVRAQWVDGVHPVRAWRKHRKMTAKALAERSGISNAYISQIEAGKRKGTAATLNRLAKALDAPLDALLPT